MSLRGVVQHCGAPDEFDFDVFVGELAKDKALGKRSEVWIVTRRDRDLGSLSLGPVTSAAAVLDRDTREWCHFALPLFY